ncbi:9905_t:CDS:2, partial [Ambispora gerdemannii]
ISPNIKEGAKISVLNSVVSENTARSLLGDILDAQPEMEIEISVGRMKFEAISTANDEPNPNLNNINNKSEESANSETDISSDSDQSVNRETTIARNTNNMLWKDGVVTIDPRKIFRSYSNAPIVNIPDITHASPRQFFEHFLPIEYIMSTVITTTNKCTCACEQTWNDLTWMEFMRFIGILTIMTYVKCTDICDYWSIKSETDVPANDDPFYFARQFHDVFNDNLIKAIVPGAYLCIDKS